MTRAKWLMSLGAIVAAALLAGWIANHTSWIDVEVPLPPSGEALTNPTYAAQRFVEHLGATAVRDLSLTMPAPDGVLVLSTWNFGLTPERATQVQGWVESGGRLVIDATVSVNDEFTRWSGISHALRMPPGGPTRPQLCRRLAGPASTQHWLCGLTGFSELTSSRPPEWFLRDSEVGIQALRVRIGRGTITVVNAVAFQHRNLFDGDNGWVLVTGSQIRRGDVVHFLSESEYPTLFALVWQHGAPLVMLVVVLTGLVVWRAAVRLGPLEPAPSRGRRSLAEQIRGTGSFVVRHGGGDALQAATARAFHEAARRRIAGYTALPDQQRLAALAEITGVQQAVLTEALFTVTPHRQQLSEAIEILERARRTLLTRHGAGSRPGVSRS